MTRKIVELWKDDDKMELVTEMLRTGASLSTIEAKINLPSGTLSRWLRQGRDQKYGVYRDFYEHFRSSIADAKHLAEAKMLERSPERWLERSTTAKMVESEEDAALAAQSHSGHIQVGAEKALQALTILHRQGISIDELISKGQLSVANPLLSKKDISNEQATIDSTP